MAGVNKVFLLGNLGADPEIKTFDDGNSIANLRIATTEVFRDRNNERQERTEWHRVVVRGRQAKVAEQYLQKGKQIFLEGKITTRKFQDKDGNDRFITEIIAFGFQMLGQPGGGGQQNNGPQESMNDQQPEESQQGEDDLPF